MSDPKLYVPTQVFVEPTKKAWTMKDVQGHLFDILQADHPLTADQRKALKGVIEMCDLWNKMSPGFAKALKDLEEKFNKHTNTTPPGPTAAPAPTLEKRCPHTPDGVPCAVCSYQNTLNATVK